MNDKDWQPHESVSRAQYVMDLERKVEELEESIEETEHDMHMRIRASYDKTIADSWRAALSKVEAERDALAEKLKIKEGTIDLMGQFTEKLQGEFDDLQESSAAQLKEALANSDACWRMEQEFLQRKLAGFAAHINSLEGLLVDAARERDEAKNRARRACQILIEEIGADGPTDVDTVAERAVVRIRELRDQVDDLRAAQEESEHQMHLRIRAGYDKTVADSWRAKVAEVERERDEARHNLGEILAVIHRDGGHHTGEFGVSQSLADAHATWAVVVRERDEALAEVKQLREALGDANHAATLAKRERDTHENRKIVAELEVARREREHEALLETAQKALAHVRAEIEAIDAVRSGDFDVFLGEVWATAEAICARDRGKR